MQIETHVNFPILIDERPIFAMSMNEENTFGATNVNPTGVPIGKIEQLVAPFEIESQNYECQCKSCRRIRGQGLLLSRLCIIGIFCPFIWFCEIALCLYLQWFTSNDPTHPPIDPDRLPTEYELFKNRNRTEMTIDSTTSQDMKMINGPIKDCSESEVISTKDDEMKQDDRLKWIQYNFLRDIAIQVIDSHYRQRAYLWKWVWICTAAIASYALVLGVILAATLRG